jgi:hypothetical protein
MISISANCTFGHTNYKSMQTIIEVIRKHQMIVLSLKSFGYCFTLLQLKIISWKSETISNIKIMTKTEVNTS